MNLEFFIRLKEMVSGGLAKIAQTAVKTANQAKNANGILGQSYDQIKQKVMDLESVIGKSTSIKQIREARRELEQLQRLQSRHPGNTSSGGNWFSNGIKQALPVMGLAGALALGGSVLNSGLEAQARQTSFGVMAGKQEGTRLNNDLTKYAQDSIYGNEVYQNAQTMMAFGIGSKEVMGDLKMLGDIAMGDANKLGSLTLAFSQVNAAGKLTGQDLLQFVNAGFNPLQEIAKKTGIKMGDLREAVSDGAISFQMVEAAFKSATSEGGKFFNMTNEIAKTDYGKMQAFLGQLGGLGMKIGGILAPALGLVLSILSPIVELISSSIGFLQEHAEAVQLVVLVLGVAAGAYGIFAAVLSAGTIATQIVTWATTLWTGAQYALNLAMSLNPIGAVIALIAGLVAGIIFAWNKFEGFRMVVYGLWGAFKQVFENIGGYFKKVFEPIFEAIEAFKKGDWVGTGKAVAKIGLNMVTLGGAAAVEYGMEGGFTKGVADAYKNESVKGLNKKSGSVSASDVAAPADNSGLFAGLSKYKGSSTGDDAVKGVTSGGPRVININGVRFADKIEIHAQSFEKGMDSVKDQLDEYLLRILNSGAAVQ
jgi:tape measure domain-containing protein